MPNSVSSPTSSPSCADAAPRVYGTDNVVVGIDIGGTKISAGLANLAGELLAVLEQPTQHGKNAPFLPQIETMVAALCTEASVARSKLVHAVVGVPGAICPATGRVSLSPNLAFPDNRPASVLMSERLACPVEVENDVSLAGFGEAMSTPGFEDGVLAFVSFGTGVGLGLVANGSILRGAHGRAGEIAYLPIGGDPHQSAPGTMRGLYEDAVGSSGIAARYGVEGITVAEIFDRAATSDDMALAVIDEVARIASVGLAAVQTLIDPHVLVLGGSIGVRTKFVDAVRLHMAVLLPYVANVQISKHGRNAGLMGAVHAAVRAVRQGSVSVAWGNA